MVKGGCGYIFNFVSYVCEYFFIMDLLIIFGVELCGFEFSFGYGFRVFF